MANTSKRHHFIPVTYLNGFTDKSGRLFVYRSDDPARQLHLKPESIAFENHYYSQPTPDGGWNNRLEDMFGAIETQWPFVIQGLQSKSKLTDRIDHLLQFLLALRVRVPAIRDAIEHFLADTVKAKTGAMHRAGELPPPPPGLENIVDQLVVAIDPHQSIVAMSHLASGFESLLERLGFEVLHCKCTETLITTDNPVVYFDPRESEDHLTPYGLREQGSAELLFPIDSRTVLRGLTSDRKRYLRNGLRHVDVRDRKTIGRINRLVARFGYGLMFSADETHQDLAIRHASQSPVLRTLSLPTFGTAQSVSVGWAFGARRRKIPWVEK